MSANPPVITIQFSQPINPATVTAASMFFTGPGGGLLPIGPYSFSAGNTKVSFTPTAALTANVLPYHVHITAGVLTPLGIPLTTPVSFPVVAASTLQCSSLVYPGSYPNTWANGPTLVPNPRFLIVPGITRTVANGIVVALLGGRAALQASEKTTNAYKWNGTLQSLTSVGGLGALPFDSNLSSADPPQPAGAIFVMSSVSSAITDPNTCKIFVQGVPSHNGFQNESGDTILEVGGPSYFTPTTGAWSLPNSFRAVSVVTGGTPVQVQVSAAGNGAGYLDVKNGQKIFLGGVTGAGGPLDGEYTVTTINGNTFTLDGSSDTGPFVLAPGATISLVADMTPLEGHLFNPASIAPYMRAKTQTLFRTASGKIVYMPASKVGLLASLGFIGPMIFDPDLLTNVSGAVYPPAAGQDGSTWTQFGACQLADGRILVAGGLHGHTLFPDEAALTIPQAFAAIYDPSFDTWLTVTPMNHARRLHTLIRLDSGRILAVGGTNGIETGTDSPTEWGNPVGVCEIYDPGLNSWTDIGSLITPRTSNFAVKLPTGEVMVGCGVNNTDTFLGTTEILGASLTWNVGPATNPRADVAAIVVPDAAQYTVLLAGGRAPAPIVQVSFLTNPTGGPPPFGGPPL